MIHGKRKIFIVYDYHILYDQIKICLIYLLLYKPKRYNNERLEDAILQAHQEIPILIF
jgi:hypothetical protein